MHGNTKIKVTVTSFHYDTASFLSDVSEVLRTAGMSIQGDYFLLTAVCGCDRLHSIKVIDMYPFNCKYQSILFHCFLTAFDKNM